MDNPNSLVGRRIFVAGHCGMVGSAVLRHLRQEPVTLLTARRAELDLTRQHEVESWVREARPDVVIVAAAKVGGIFVNSSKPVDFLEQNLLIELNLIRASFMIGVRKLLFLGSSCIYPKHAAQPIREDALFTGALEPTNEWYATAKIAGIQLCRAYRRQYGADFISAMPTNLYGPGDNFDLETSHVVPALVRRIHEAKIEGLPEVEIWGTGTPRREFLHVDDMAAACLLLLERYGGESPVNVGAGEDLTIAELAALIAKIVGFDGQLRFNPAYPDGTPRKLLDSSRLVALGWQPTISLAEGLRRTYAWYLAERAGKQAAA